MKTPAVFDSSHVPETEPPGYWVALVRGEPEPLFLSRLLQKLVTQDAVLDSLRFDLASDQLASVEIRFRATRSRAERLEKLWLTLVSVQEASVESLKRLRPNCSPRSRAKI